MKRLRHILQSKHLIKIITIIIFIITLLYTNYYPFKKQALLKKFGSVEKIKKANVQEIMEVDGINEILAKKILEKLSWGEDG